MTKKRKRMEGRMGKIEKGMEAKKSRYEVKEWKEKRHKKKKER